MMATRQTKTNTMFSAATIPDQLKQVDRWAPWRLVWNDKREKYEKVPHRAGLGG